MNRGGSENIGSDDGREKDSIWFLLFDASSKTGGGEHTINFACGRAGRDEPSQSKRSSSGAERKVMTTLIWHVI